MRKYLASITLMFTTTAAVHQSGY